MKLLLKMLMMGYRKAMQNSRYGNVDYLYKAVVQNRTNKELGKGSSHFLLEVG